MFTDNQDRVCILYIVMDERLFSDTMFRVVRIGVSRFVVYDIRYLNGKDVYETETYAQRKQRVHDLLVEFHFPDMIALDMPEDLPLWEFPIRGYECYDDQPGSLGVFLPTEK